MTSDKRTLGPHFAVKPDSEVKVSRRTELYVGVLSLSPSLPDGSPIFEPSLRKLFVHFLSFLLWLSTLSKQMALSPACPVVSVNWSEHSVSR